jgi:hypothetical protein
MWGYVEGNATLMGCVVLVVAIAAVAYVVARIVRRSR